MLSEDAQRSPFWRAHLQPTTPQLLRAVSYTHLDVYKRQDQACALARFALYATDDGLRSFLGVLNVGEQAERFEEVFLIEALEGLLHAECQTIDVYKRQL